MEQSIAKKDPNTTNSGTHNRTTTNSQSQSQAVGSIINFFAISSKKELAQRAWCGLQFLSNNSSNLLSSLGDYYQHLRMLPFESGIVNQAIPHRFLKLGVLPSDPIEYEIVEIFTSFAKEV